MPIARYISIQDYPSAALLARQQGRVGVRLGVSAAGRVTDCTVTLSSGAAILDASTCRLLRSRVRFDPARDAQGAAVAGTYSTHVDWTLPIMQAPMRPGA
jgi:protein TonB